MSKRIELINYDDILSMMVGKHYPQDDARLDRECRENVGNLKLIALWVARHLSLDGELDEYKHQSASSLTVASLHEQAIMEMLEWFEPQVKTYYMKYLNNMDDEEDE